MTPALRAAVPGRATTAWTLLVPTVVNRPSLGVTKSRSGLVIRRAPLTVLSVVGGARLAGVFAANPSDLKSKSDREPTPVRASGGRGIYRPYSDQTAYGDGIALLFRFSKELVCLFVGKCPRTHPRKRPAIQNLAGYPLV